MRLEEKVAEFLVEHGKTIAVAESCTGGLMASRLTDVPGSSAFLKLGIVTYSDYAKTRLLKVPASIIKTHGAVSDETACLMAKGARLIQDTDFGVGITGIAGPSGGSKKKPVGLVFIAVNTKEETLCLKCQFKGTRGRIKTQAVNQAFKILLEFLD